MTSESSGSLKVGSGLAAFVHLQTRDAESFYARFGFVPHPATANPRYVRIAERLRTTAPTPISNSSGSAAPP